MSDKLRQLVNKLIKTTQEYFDANKDECLERAAEEGSSIVFEMADTDLYVEVLNQCEAEDEEFEFLDEIESFWIRNEL